MNQKKTATVESRKDSALSLIFGLLSVTWLCGLVGVALFENIDVEAGHALMVQALFFALPSACISAYFCEWRPPTRLEKVFFRMSLCWALAIAIAAFFVWPAKTKPLEQWQSLPTLEQYKDVVSSGKTIVSFPQYFAESMQAREDYRAFTNGYFLRVRMLLCKCFLIWVIPSTLFYCVVKWAQRRKSVKQQSAR